MSRLPPRLVAAKKPASRRRLPRETFGMLRDRGFRLTIYCDPCKEVTGVNLIERPELAQVEIGSVDFECRHCRKIGHYRLEPPHHREKRLLHEQAIGCRGPADYDPKPFIGPFPLLSKYGDELVGDYAALGLCLLATCPGGRERLIDPRDADWHHLHERRLDRLRLRCEGCRQRATVVVVPSWYRRKGFNVVRASQPHAPLRPRTEETGGQAYSNLQDVDEIWRRKQAEAGKETGR
jgi:hypothetical protein